MTTKKPAESGSSERTMRGTLASHGLKRIPAVFFRTEAGNEPVREWLKAMAPEDRRRIGEDIRTVEYGWPIGMPVCRPLGNGLHEVRTNLTGNRIARVFFSVDARQQMVLLHAIVKKTQAIPTADLELARKNKTRHERGIA
ncbi:MAG TPA: type II toxin-antitoxin system RelE/ParE family toxin [Terracidiphilus sp.]|nr:type II toxin-antitoxin system RelE/ParE family toxin [Terracidiphilus sp.]